MHVFQISFRRTCNLAITAAFAALLCTSQLCAQLTTGSIAGSVQDPSGAAVAGTSVTAVQTETGVSRQTTSNQNGEFTFNSMQPGVYMLTFTAQGFKTKHLAHLTLTTGETLPVTHVGLEVGAVTQTTTVSAEGSTVMTQSSEISDLLSSTQIQSLVVRGRNFTDLVTLAPGVIDTSQSQNISSGPTIYVNGNRSNSNSIFIDGVPADDMSSTGMKDMVSQDAVEEVKLETSNYEAEYGRQSGSNIIAVTKSGTKTYHGLVSYFNRNEDYNANNYFNNRNHVARPVYRYNTVTYNVGGPVWIPHVIGRNAGKLFFFWNQEFWPISSTTTGSVTVPTAIERQGNFSQSYNPGGQLYVVKDPYNNNQPFPNNTIPGTETDANGLALLKRLPLPNFTNTAVSKGNYNYVFTTSDQTPLGTQTLRMDYNLNVANSISGSYNAFNENVTGALGLPDSSGNWPLVPWTYYTDFKAASGRWMHIFSPSLLNEASFGFLYQPAGDTYSSNALQSVTKSNVGFNLGQFFPAANPLNILPNASFGGIPNDATISIPGRFPLYNRYYLYNFTDNVSYTRSSHNIKAGIYWEYYTRTQKTQNGGSSNGSFDFQNNAKNPLNTGYAYGNAALGTFNEYTERSIPGLFTLQDTDIEGYVQDNWRITSKLTVDYGLRFTYVTPFTEVNNQVSAFIPSRYDPSQAAHLIVPAIVNGARIGIDPGTGQQYPAADIGAISPSLGNAADGMVAASSPGSAPRSLTPGAGLQLGPRFGFAYDVFGNGKTALRGGFGVFQNRFSENYFDNFVGLPPLAQTPVLYYGQLSTLLSSSGLVFPNNVYGVASAGHLAMVMNYSLGVQQDIGFGTMLSLAYVGEQSRHLSALVDQNAIAIGADFLPANQDPTQKAGTPYPTSFYRPILGYNAIYNLSNGFNSGYNSMQISVQRRFAHSLQFGVAYTWAKVMDFNDSDTDTLEPVVPLRAYYRSVAAFDVPQALEANFVYDLPSVRWENVFARTVINNWSISDISNFQRGNPLGVTITTTNGEDITGSTSIAPRAVLSGNANLSRGDRTFARYFNTSAVQLPAVGTFGNAPRTFIIGPGVDNFNLALLKNIPLHERLSLQLRFEAYNAFNHTQYSTINSTAEFNPSTGQQINAQFGQVTVAHDPRQLQLSARLSF
jgi:hypothetical protein